jgi:hypothetical protein
MKENGASNKSFVKSNSSRLPFQKPDYVVRDSGGNKNPFTMGSGSGLTRTPSKNYDSGGYSSNNPFNNGGYSKTPTNPFANRDGDGRVSTTRTLHNNNLSQASTRNPFSSSDTSTRNPFSLGTTTSNRTNNPFNSSSANNSNSSSSMNNPFSSSNSNTHYQSKSGSENDFFKFYQEIASDPYGMKNKVKATKTSNSTNYNQLGFM